MYTVAFMLGLLAMFTSLTSRAMPTDLKVIMFLCGIGLIVMSYGQPN